MFCAIFIFKTRSREKTAAGGWKIIEPFPKTARKEWKGYGMK